MPQKGRDIPMPLETVVYVPGVWDMLHVGHLNILEAAYGLGTVLIVGVPSDEVVLEDKGQLPVVCLQDRVRMLQALEVTDVVLPYYQLEFLTHLRMLRPDVLVIGQTWGREQRHIQATKFVSDQGGRVVMLPYTPGISTSELRSRANT